MKKILLLSLVLFGGALLLYQLEVQKKEHIDKAIQASKVGPKQSIKLSQILKEKVLKEGKEEVPCETSECQMEVMKQLYEAGQDRPLDQLNKFELIVKMVFPLFTNGFENLDAAEMSKLADLVIERDSTVYAAHKVKLIALALPFMTGGKGNEEAILNKLDEMENDYGADNDSQLGGIRAFIYKKTQKMNRLEGYSKKLIEAHPYLGAGYYYRAMFKREKKDLKGIEQSLRRAVEVEPENESYRETLKKFKAGVKDYFTTTLSFNFDNI